MNTDIYKIVINYSYSYNVHEYFLKKLKYFDFLDDGLVEKNVGNTYQCSINTINSKLIFDIFFKMLYGIDENNYLSLEECRDLKYVCDYFQIDDRNINNKIVQYYLPSIEVIDSDKYNDYFINIDDIEFRKSILSKLVKTLFKSTLFNLNNQIIAIVIDFDPPKNTYYIGRQLVRRNSMINYGCGLGYINLDQNETYESYFEYIVNDFLKLFGIKIRVSLDIYCNDDGKLHIGDFIIKYGEKTYCTTFQDCGIFDKTEKVYMSEKSCHVAMASFNLNDIIHDLIIFHYGYDC